jgi:hypothetical protein
MGPVYTLSSARARLLRSGDRKISKKKKRFATGKTRFYHEHCMDHVMREMKKLLDATLGESSDVDACEIVQVDDAHWSIASRV